MGEKKPKMIAVTDPTEVERLLAGKDDISVPFTQKPNGHLWVEADQMQDWREGRK